MKLDNRIIEGKKPLDCFDAENKELIKPFLNKEGYVSNNLENFCLLDGCFKRLLSNVSKDVKDCFKTSINDGDGGNWKYFLPVEWVKEPEKKYRAYTLKEFIGDVNLGLGPWIRMRPIGANKECKFLYTGYQETEVGEYICLGCYQFDFISLFKNYEIYINGEWQPFGVLEDGAEE